MGSMHETPDISSDRKNANREVLAGLPKVLLHDHLK